MQQTPRFRRPPPPQNTNPSIQITNPTPHSTPNPTPNVSRHFQITSTQDRQIIPSSRVNHPHAHINATATYTYDVVPRRMPRPQVIYQETDSTRFEVISDNGVEQGQGQSQGRQGSMDQVMQGQENDDGYQQNQNQDNYDNYEGYQGEEGGQNQRQNPGPRSQAPAHLSIQKRSLIQNQQGGRIHENTTTSFRPMSALKGDNSLEMLRLRQEYIKEKQAATMGKTHDEIKSSRSSLIKGNHQVDSQLKSQTQGNQAIQGIPKAAPYVLEDKTQLQPQTPTQVAHPSRRRSTHNIPIDLNDDIIDFGTDSKKRVAEEPIKPTKRTKPEETFAIPLALTSLTSLNRGFDITKIWKERAKAAENLGSETQWGTVSKIFEKQQGRIEGMADRFNLLLGKYNALCDIKNETLADKENKTAQYADAGNELCQSCAEIQANTRQMINHRQVR